MEDNKIIRILIPVVSVLIIFESIMLVSGLQKKTVSTSTENIATNMVVTVTPKEVNNNSIIGLNLVSSESAIKVGKSYKVTLNLTAKQEIKLNALDLYVKYNPEVLTISNLVSGKDIVKPSFMKVSDKKSVVATSFLFTAKDGTVFAKDKETNILTFNITPKKAGVSSLQISTGDSQGDSVTMLVDKATSKALPFSSNKLEIKLID